MDNTYILIMAGGEGTRFAPLSTPEQPKQFLNLIGEGTFIQQTRNRIADLVKTSHVFVATNNKYVPLVRKQLPDILVENIIGEPLKKNTAPCIAYATRLIYERDPSAIVIVLPSDHVILKLDKFKEVIRFGVEIARRADCLVTLGIKPSWPSTEYGYIRANTGQVIFKNGINNCEDINAHAVQRFVEKPNSDNAKKYVKDGGYFWNSGMFIWKSSRLLMEVSKYLPQMYGMLKKFEDGEAFINRFFEAAQAISIDYGVMEKSKRAVVVPCDLGWSDVGTWESLYRLYHHDNLTISNHALQVMRQTLGYVYPQGHDSIPRRIDKPWGYEEIWAHTERYVGKILNINKSQRLSYQYHRVKEETIRILKGVMDLEYEHDDSVKTIRLTEGDVFHIPPTIKHRMVAIEDCRVLEVSTPYLEDIVRLKDDYNRT